MRGVVLFLLVFVSSCGDRPKVVPTCSEAMTAFYNSGCSIFDAGEPVNLADAIMGCNGLVVDAAALGGSCPDRMDDLLICLENVNNTSQCETCNDELGRLRGCS